MSSSQFVEDRVFISKLGPNYMTHSLSFSENNPFSSSIPSLFPNQLCLPSLYILFHYTRMFMDSNIKLIFVTKPLFSFFCTTLVHYDKISVSSFLIRLIPSVSTSSFSSDYFFSVNISGNPFGRYHLESTTPVNQDSLGCGKSK